MDFGYMNQNIDLRDKVKKFIKRFENVHMRVVITIDLGVN